MNFLHKTEELSRFENELFLEFFAIKEYILHLEDPHSSSDYTRCEAITLWMLFSPGATPDSVQCCCRRNSKPGMDLLGGGGVRVRKGFSLKSCRRGGGGGWSSPKKQFSGKIF